MVLPPGTPFGAVVCTGCTLRRSAPIIERNSANTSLTIMATLSPADLRILLKLFDTRSVTAAAAGLDVDKSQVSRTLARIERRLGVRLFERSTRALHPTAIGVEVCTRARDVLAGLHAIDDLAATSRGTPSGTLRLGCGVEFGMLAVSEWITTYLARYPHVAVNADFSNRVVDVIEEGFDLVIRLGPIARAELVAVSLGSLAYGMYASPHSSALPTHPSALSPADILCFSAGSHGAGWRLFRDGEAVSITPAGRATLNNVHALADAARAGLGVARLPRRLAAAYLARGELREVFGDWSLDPVEVHAVLPGNRYIPPKVSVFLDIARAAMLAEATSAPPGVCTRGSTGARN
ncbi:MAG: LysR family transcriptional regulator [Gammaproteobacteria bacterium]